MMLIKLSKVLAIVTIASLFATQARADTEPVGKVALDEIFKAAYFDNGENTIEQSGFLGQINTIVGIPKFPEQDITADMKEVHRVYQLALERQTSMGEPLITRDLDNPYDTSLRELPSDSSF